MALLVTICVINSKQAPPANAPTNPPSTFGRILFLSPAARPKINPMPIPMIPQPKPRIKRLSILSESSGISPVYKAWANHPLNTPITPERMVHKRIFPVFLLSRTTAIPSPISKAMTPDHKTADPVEAFVYARSRSDALDENSFCSDSSCAVTDASSAFL